jgi:hypothetical protein
VKADVRRVTIEERPGAGRLGRHVEHDPRSREFPFRLAAGTPTIRRVVHRHYGVLDQGGLGSCTGNAAAGALNTVPLHRKGGRVWDEDEAVAVYERATVLDTFPGEYPPDDTGSSGLAAAKACAWLGLISGYRHAFGITDALAALMAGPVITGVNWYEAFDQPDTAGRVSVGGQVRGGHEFVVIGYEPGRDGEGTVLAVNSWGRGWGRNGRFTFSTAMWAQLLAEDGDATILLPK